MYKNFGAYLDESIIKKSAKKRIPSTHKPHLLVAFRLCLESRLRCGWMNPKKFVSRWIGVFSADICLLKWMKLYWNGCFPKKLVVYFFVQAHLCRIVDRVSLVFVVSSQSLQQLRRCLPNHMKPRWYSENWHRTANKNFSNRNCFASRSCDGGAHHGKDRRRRVRSLYHTIRSYGESS